jgi:hypothetical protein
MLSFCAQRFPVLLGLVLERSSRDLIDICTKKNTLLIGHERHFLMHLPVGEDCDIYVAQWCVVLLDVQGLPQIAV